MSADSGRDICDPYDLLTEDDKKQLAEDLRRIHDTVRPCWARGNDAR